MDELRKVADELQKRAEAFREPYGGNMDFYQSGSYPIYAALIEVSIVIRSVCEPLDGTDK